MDDNPPPLQPLQPPRPSHSFREFLPIFQPASSSSLSPSSSDRNTHTTTTLCALCTPIATFLQSNLPTLSSVSQFYKHTFPHHLSGAALESSHKSGCHLCTHLWVRATEDSCRGHGLGRMKTPQGIVHARYRERLEALEEQTRRYEGQISVEIGKAKEIGGSPLVPNVRCGTFIARLDVRGVGKERHEGEGMWVVGGEPWDGFARFEGKGEAERGWPVRTDSDWTMGLARRWLGECVEGHADCGTKSAEGMVPTRLLRVPRVGGDGVVRLVETAVGGLEDGEGRRYAALSYCWGGSATTMLTVSSRAGFLTRGVDISELPQTVQDAVKVTRELGLKWLWVDSLCIIQDSKEDWLHEAGRMADIYRDAEICIAALGAMSSDQGIFCRRDPLRYTPCRLGNGVTLLSPYMTADMARSQGIEWPLETRGWVVQERMLARRTLKFGTYVSWECREGIKDEFLVEEGNTTWSKHHWSRRLSELTERGRAIADEQLRDTWQRILELYAESSLTVKSDRLVAISGIIQAISRATGYRNIAGLWEPHLVSSLMWKVRYFGNDSEYKGSKTGLSPSWSWAALDSTILADGAREMPDTDRDIAVRTCTAQEAVAHGVIPGDGLGQEMPLHFRTMKIDSGLYTLVREFSDTELAWSLGIKMPRWPIGAFGKIHVDMPVESDEGKERLSLVPLRFQWQPGTLTQYRAGRMMGLVVRPSGRYPGAFERVGVWYLDFTKKEGEDLGPFDRMVIEQEGWRDIVLV